MRRFKGTNKISVARWSTKPRVVAAERGREFAFVTEFRGKDNTKWTYRFEPSGAGTKVTESFELCADTMKAIDVAERYLFRHQGPQGPPREGHAGDARAHQGRRRALNRYLPL